MMLIVHSFSHMARCQTHRWSSPFRRTMMRMKVTTLTKIEDVQVAC